MAHLHITAWVLAFILLFIATALYKQGKGKPGKILHMILRLDYLLILFSGGSLLADYMSNGAGSYLPELIVKIIAGLWAIVAMEMIGVRTSKGNPAKGWWIQFAVVAIIAIGLGFGRLPYGILP